MIRLNDTYRSRIVTMGWSLPLVMCILCASCRPKQTTLNSDPPGATVWAGERIVGQTPVSVPRDLVDPVELRFSLPGCQDRIVSFDPAARHPGNEFTVALDQPTDLALTCESRPEGADVYMDGEFQGRTPLKLTKLEPRTIELVFRMRNRKTVTRSVDMGARQNSLLVVELPSKTEEYYRQQLTEEPRNIHHYADLAHHYILEGRVDDAMNVFADAVTVLVKTPGIGDASRLWSEMQRVTDEQYEYGSDDVVTNARRALRDTLAELLGKYPNAPFPYLHVNYVLVLDRLNQRQQAQEAFEKAWRRFPNDRTLKRLRRQGFAAP